MSRKRAAQPDERQLKRLVPGDRGGANGKKIINYVDPYTGHKFTARGVQNAKNQGVSIETAKELRAAGYKNLHTTQRLLKNFGEQQRREGKKRQPIRELARSDEFRKAAKALGSRSAKKRIEAMEQLGLRPPGFDKRQGGYSKAELRKAWKAYRALQRRKR